MHPLYFGSLLWPSSGGLPARYPPLAGDINCDVLVVGGGLTGTLIAHALTSAGLDAVLIEENRIGSGSSSASTGLLQYSNDVMLSELVSLIGEEVAVYFYRECKHAVERLCSLAERLPADVGFKRRSSLYYASSQQDVPKLQAEYETLHQHGFSVDWLDEDGIRSLFPFSKPAALVTNGDGEINPYRWAVRLAEQTAAQGLRIFEKTALKSVVGPKGALRCNTSGGVIQACSVVYAVGYRPEIAGTSNIGIKLARTHVIATKPLSSLSQWHQRWLIWETARPYLYARTTQEGRIILGGFDEDLPYPAGSREELDKRAAHLLQEAERLFPGLTLATEYAWSALFGESKDNLPWIGEDPEHPGRYLALGYGGNGAVYSMLASGIVLDALLGKANPLNDIVGLRNRRTGLPK